MTTVQPMLTAHSSGEVSEKASTTGRERSSSTWLLNGYYDVGLVFGGGSLVSLLIYLAWSRHDSFLVVSAGFAILLDLPHVLQTTFRVSLDPIERELWRRRYLASLVVSGAAFSTFAFTGHVSLLVITWVVWQVFHVLKQHYGLLSVYAAKARYRGPKRLVKAALFAGCLAPLLYRVHLGLHFGRYVVAGRSLPFSDVRVPAPPVPLPVVVAGFVVAAAIVTCAVGQQVRLRRRGMPTLPAMATLTAVYAIAIYNLAYLTISDLYPLIIIATATHSLQYHLISWRRNRGAAESPEAPALFSRLSRPAWLGVFALCLTLPALVLANLETVLFGVVPLTLVFQHFYLDGYLWKAPRNPTLAHDLGLV